MFAPTLKCGLRVTKVKAHWVYLSGQGYGGRDSDDSFAHSDRAQTTGCFGDRDEAGSTEMVQDNFFDSVVEDV